MSGINDHLYAKNYFNRAQAIDKIEAKGERADLRLNTRVNALSPQAKQLPAWVKPAGYAALAISAIAATAFISSQTAPQTSTPNPNPNPGTTPTSTPNPEPNPAPLDPSTREISIDPKSTPDPHSKWDILINLGGDIHTLDEIPSDDDRGCSVTYTPYTSDGRLEGSLWRYVVFRKGIKKVIEKMKEDYSNFDGRLEVKIDCDSEFAKSKTERFQKDQEFFVNASKSIRL